MRIASPEANLNQARMMVEFSRILLPDRILELYVSGRAATENNCFSDQRFMACILATEAPETLPLFWQAYPNIFGPEIEAAKAALVVESL